MVVPRELALGRTLLSGVALSSSFAYYLGTGAWLVVTLVPWCACMGATFPIAMAALRARSAGGDGQRSFSALYVANVAGAVAGATVPLFLIELLGFRGTSHVAALFNGALAALVLALDAATAPSANARAAVPTPRLDPAPPSAVTRAIDRAPLSLLFLSGLTSMGMEVIWIRQITQYLGTVVYAFGSILAVYLGATFLGSRRYRRWSRDGREDGEDGGGDRRVHPALWSLLGLAALLPLLTANPAILRFTGSRWLRLAGGIGPASFLFGFVTPMLVDRRSRGDADRAGAAYAVNVIGCILGPLVAGFVLLPLVSARWALLLLALPWLAVGLLWTNGEGGRAPVPWRRPRWQPLAAVATAALLVVTGRAFEDQFPRGVVLRDSTATVVAAFDQGHERLIVNGQGMTI